ncbi:flagellar hook capping protein [Thermodesulfatator indicus DSM 15286]|uniref:Basal-body rod modification protein FlgD n=1 Tax=Thermodesulfatator indicus (strain DSM 15286 / JCM 11887 / CIR29812) TaxID=667014 RepID=F8ADD1_THEID|nr:flagellar hook capping FlgD N-terminal domain-containing protein [Thermodesulfatator indicus]AEH45946.1 flagellar hook capping protein [Thermodesulfatator indicus DSM 15286]
MINNTEQAPKLFTELDNSPKTRVPKKVLDRDDFMVLFIKQLEYQDPLKPLDNNEMATQLALFNQVDQLYDLNEKLSKIADIAKGSTLQTIASLIGKKASVKNHLLRVEGGKFLGGEIEAKEATDNILAKIYDANGNLVKVLDLGPLSVGKHELDWDATDKNGNQVADGTYRLVLEPKNPKDLDNLSIKTIGRLTGALLEDGEYKLLFNGKDTISLTDLEKVLAEDE